jgi:dimethylhistidine N-methyltransferase
MSSATHKPPAVQNCAPDAACFQAEVLRGLRRPVKELPCKYFYDEEGARLFEEICDLDEYYPTRTELAIMRRQVADMASRLGPRCFLIEYGSGSGIKTRLLLDHLPEPAAYVPVDISGEQLARSAQALAARYPGLEVLPVCADFTRPLRLPHAQRPAARRAVYFPGSTIGNFGPGQAVALLGGMAQRCARGGGLLIGVDLKKDARILEPAYNDRKGVTAAFNLNLLRRINCELGADFRLDRYRHHAFYNAERGRIEMHLVSLEAQAVCIGPARFSLAKGESIRTECSYKYSLDEFRALAAAAGLEVEQVWTDEQQLFSVQYLVVV